MKRAGGHMEECIPAAAIKAALERGAATLFAVLTAATTASAALAPAVV